MPKTTDISNQKFNRLTAVSLVGFDRFNKSVWKFLCDCGSEFISNSASVKSGKTKSCGCLKKEKAIENGKKSLGPPIKHGGSKTPEYKIWKTIKQRCSNKNCTDYPEYGGRGIFICHEWENDFSKFLQDMGKRPSTKHSIDRLDNNKGYSKDNCRWATAKEQRLNQRRMK